MSFEKPATHPRISQEERAYIEESLGLADNTVLKVRPTRSSQCPAHNQRTELCFSVFSNAVEEYIHLNACIRNNRRQHLPKLDFLPVAHASD